MVWILLTTDSIKSVVLVVSYYWSLSNGIVYREAIEIELKLYFIFISFLIRINISFNYIEINVNKNLGISIESIDHLFVPPVFGLGDDFDSLPNRYFSGSTKPKGLLVGVIIILPVIKFLFLKSALNSSSNRSVPKWTFDSLDSVHKTVLIWFQFHRTYCSYLYPWVWYLLPVLLFPSVSRPKLFFHQRT